MPLFIDWIPTSENGARFVETDQNTLSGPSSLLARSDGTEFDATEIGFRKSAAIYLNTQHARGFSDGRLRTLVRRDSPNQSEGWSGIYIMSDRLGIGTRLDPGLNMYQISDEDGTIKIIKVTGGIKTTLLDTLQNFFAGQVYGFEVTWEYDPVPDRTLIEVKLGTNVDFSDLTTIGTFSDITSPHQFSDSEGIFFQTESHDDLVDYTYDKTSIFRIVTI